MLALSLLTFLSLSWSGRVVHGFTPTSSFISSTPPARSSFGVVSSTTTNGPTSTTSCGMSMAVNKPKGCAAVPFDKKKIAVFGAGGYLGSIIYGFLQRASSIYGTGVSNVQSSPRVIGATSSAATSLNKYLGRHFNLAFAGEDMIRLTNMKNLENIIGKIKDMDAAVLGTHYTLAKTSVTLNTYEKTPNDKTLEFYLDNAYAVDAAVSDDDLDVHLEFFRNTLEACKAVNMKHVVIVETPGTGTNSQQFAIVLEEICDSQMTFTYIHTEDGLEWDNTKMYTFDKGLQSMLDIKSYPTIDSLKEDEGSTSTTNGIFPREDLAALAVQSLMSLDWGKSRYLNAGIKERIKTDEEIIEEQKANGTYVYVPSKPLKVDNEWCVKSDLVADALSSVQ